MGGKPLNLVVALAGAALIAAFVWQAIRPPREFVVRVRGGRAWSTRGRAPAEFVEAVGEACASAGVVEAKVEGVRQGERVSLLFSGGIPPALRQRIRNLWNLPR